LFLTEQNNRKHGIGLFQYLGQGNRSTLKDALRAPQERLPSTAKEHEGNSVFAEKCWAT